MPDLLQELNLRIFLVQKYFNYKLFALACKYGVGAVLVRQYLEIKEDINI